MHRGLPLLVAVLALVVACGGVQEEEALDTLSSDLTAAEKGEKLFEKATFGGNGRTCQTCHSETTGTVSPAVAKARYNANPNDPLFRRIDSDVGSNPPTYNRLLNHATIRVTIPLPSSIRLHNAPKASSLEVLRGIPTTLNTPALEAELMWDGRAPNLKAQALSAIRDHYQNSFQPSADDLSNIAAYEKTLFSSSKLASYAKGGPAPVLPAGTTASEKRGRVFFDPDGLCGMCHGGPMLNTATEFSMGAGGPGARFDTVLVSELNPGGLPMRQFDVTVTNPDGTKTVFPYEATDPGRAAITNNPDELGFFKISSLWNIKNTAPYFHDNSAPTLNAMIDHYSNFFVAVGLPALTSQQKADIVAYLKLL